MIRILSALLALLTLNACQQGGPTASTETSPGGVEYTLIQLPEQEDVAIHIAWPTDWSYRDGTNKAVPIVGTDLILAGGAEGYPAGDVIEQFADLNSEGDIYAGLNDHIIGELAFERAMLDDTIAIANAHLRAPTLDPVWLDRIRDSIAQNMAEAQTHPRHAGFDAGRWAIFKDQPLRMALSLDDPDVFETVTQDDTAAWHAETFTRQPDAIVVVGGIGAQMAGETVDRLLEGLPDTRPTLAPEVTPDFAPRRILLHDPAATVTNIAFIAPLPPTEAGKELEDLLLLNALGSGDQSVLFNAVRTELRASYGFSADVANYTRAHRIMVMSGEVETAKLADVERVVREAYDGFQKAGTLEELAERKAPFEHSFTELPNFVADQARSELQSRLDGFEVGRSLALLDELAAVTDDTVNQRLQNDFPPADTFIVIAVSPDRDALPGACIITRPRDAAEC